MGHYIKNEGMKNLKTSGIVGYSAGSSRQSKIEQMDKGGQDFLRNASEQEMEGPVEGNFFGHNKVRGFKTDSFYRNVKRNGLGKGTV